MPSDTIQDFKEYNRCVRELKAKRRAEAPIKLDEAGIAWTTANDCVHIIVVGEHGRVDFWPGTEKWKQQHGHIHGYGIEQLIRDVKRGKI